MFKNIFFYKSLIFYVSMCVSAGFPSPALDFMETTIDLNKELVENPLATFHVQADGNSMIDAGKTIKMFILWIEALRLKTIKSPFVSSMGNLP